LILLKYVENKGILGLLKDRVTDKKMADKLAAIVLSLYSQENEDEPDSVRKWLKY